MAHTADHPPECPLWVITGHTDKSAHVPHYFDFADRIHFAREARIITAEEAKVLNEFEELRKEIIQVNEFSFDLSEVIA